MGPTFSTHWSPPPLIFSPSAATEKKKRKASTSTTLAPHEKACVLETECEELSRILINFVSFLSFFEREKQEEEEKNSCCLLSLSIILPYKILIRFRFFFNRVSRSVTASEFWIFYFDFLCYCVELKGYLRFFGRRINSCNITSLIIWKGLQNRRLFL
uniref:Uncharacterized protein n=1 Tax=Salix viminalis TaxID=40686 RepID=A0A6N2N9A9_SALVM